MKRKITPTPKTELPPDVTAADLQYPSYVEKPGVPKPLTREQRDALGGDGFFELRFYQIAEGWVLLTLRIGGAGKSARNGTERYYGVTMDGKVVRVGHGPHVLKDLTVYLNQENLDRLHKYVDLWKKGMGDAGTIRDRISTRRAQGQIYRAQGRTSWMW